MALSFITAHFVLEALCGLCCGSKCRTQAFTCPPRHPLIVPPASVGPVFGVENEITISNASNHVLYTLLLGGRVCVDE